MTTPAWHTLFRSDRTAPLRFVQAVVLLLAVVCLALLAAFERGPAAATSPLGEHVGVALVCLGAALLPNAGMVWYLRRYVLTVAVAGDSVRLTTPGFFGRQRVVLLDRADLRASRHVDGQFGHAGGVSGNAPWTWLETTRGRFILDDFGEGVAAVEALLPPGPPRPPRHVPVYPSSRRQKRRRR